MIIEEEREVNLEDFYETICVNKDSILNCENLTKQEYDEILRTETSNNIIDIVHYFDEEKTEGVLFYKVESLSVFNYIKSGNSIVVKFNDILEILQPYLRKYKIKKLKGM